MSRAPPLSSPSPFPPLPPPPSSSPRPYRKIRLIESNAKCPYLKNFACKGTLRQVFYLSEAPSPPMTPYPPPPVSTVCVHSIHILIFLYSHREGGEGGELTIEKIRGAIVDKANQKYQHDWLYLRSINSIKHQLRRHLGFGVYIVN